MQGLVYITSSCWFGRFKAEKLYYISKIASSHLDYHNHNVAISCRGGWVQINLWKFCKFTSPRQIFWRWVEFEAVIAISRSQFPGGAKRYAFYILILGCFLPLYTLRQQYRWRSIIFSFFLFPLSGKTEVHQTIPKLDINVLKVELLCEMRPYCSNITQSAVIVYWIIVYGADLGDSFEMRASLLHVFTTILNMKLNLSMYF